MVEVKVPDGSITWIKHKYTVYDERRRYGKSRRVDGDRGSDFRCKPRRRHLARMLRRKALRQSATRTTTRKA